DWAVHDAPGSVYLRLVSVRWALPFEPPAVERLEPGRGTVLRAGADGLIVGAWHAADRLAEDGLEFGVVSLPWLRDVDGAWLAEVADGAPIFCLDNHYVSGGQGDAILAALVADAPEAAANAHKIG